MTPKICGKYWQMLVVLDPHVSRFGVGIHVRLYGQSQVIFTSFFLNYLVLNTQIVPDPVFHFPVAKTVG